MTVRLPSRLSAAAVVLCAAPIAGQATEGGGSGLDAATLRAIHIDLLGRPPLSAEREAWRGKDRSELVDAILAGTEFWERWLEEQLYYYLLIDNFRPSSERIAAIPAELRDRRLGVRDATHRIVLSSSFDQRNPGPDTYVTVVLEQLLGVTVQRSPRDLEAGKRMYDGEEATFLGRRGSSQADVVRFALEDPGFLTTLVEREHARLVRGEPSRREVEGWARRLAEDPLGYPALVREWLASPAYAGRLAEEIPLPNRLYVRALYVDLFDRLPDAEEERRTRAALDALADPTPLRSVLARLLLDSGRTTTPEKDAITDPTRWVAGLFERLLGREASESELKAFVTAFHDPECRPTTVVFALVSHPEYQRY